MKFDLLNQSIELNAEESPSLYNTLNMIRSLFQDVEDAADAPLSQCPIGDEKLPLEMIWLSKELISIYEDNDESLQRNRARLDSIMTKLRSAQAELEKLAEAQKLLPGKQAEYQGLEKKLTAARAAQAAYDELVAKIEAARKELAGLQGFDFDAANQKLLDLKNQIKQLEDRIRDLDSQIENLTAERDRLSGDVSSLRQDLLALQKELERLTREKENLLKQIQQAKEELAALNAAVAAARAELERLEKQIAAARQTLRDLESQTKRLDNEKTELDSEIARLRKIIADLTNDIDELRREFDQVLHPKHERLTQEKKDLQEQKRQVEQEIADLTAETNKLNAELVQLRKSLPLRMQERDQAKKRVEDYRRDMLDPVIRERDELLATEKQLLEGKSAADQKITELKTSQRELVLEIGKMKDQYDRDEKNHQKKLEDKQELIQKQEELTDRLNKASDALDIQQKQYDKLHDEDLPDAEKSLENETQRVNALRQTIDAIHSECGEKTREIERMNGELPELQEKLQNKRRIYEALTATYTTNNNDILDLERKIRELEKKNDQQRLDQYRTQLKEKQQKLEELAESCAKLDEKVRTENEKCQTLEGLKRKKEDGLKGIDQILAELKPYDTEEFRITADRTAKRYGDLLTIRNNLARSIYDASRHIIGYELTADEIYVIDLQKYLTNAYEYSNGLYNTLKECAQALKNHIMEEPK